MIAFDPWAVLLALDYSGPLLLALSCALIYLGGVRLCVYLLRDDPPQRVREAEFLHQFVGVSDNRDDGPPLLVGAAAPPSAVLCAACTSHGDRAFCDQFCLPGGHDTCCVVWDGCGCPPGQQSLLGAVR